MQGLFGVVCVPRTVRYAVNFVERNSIASFHSSSSRLVKDELGKQATVDVHRLKLWWYRIRPFNIEWDDLKRRLRRGLTNHKSTGHGLTRYFVRFPYLTDFDFANWTVSTDRTYNQGYSWAEFVRSDRSAAGSAKVVGEGQRVYPKHAFDSDTVHDGGNYFQQLFDKSLDTNHEFGCIDPVVKPVIGPPPGSKQAFSEALVNTRSDPAFRGYGHFRGFISTRVPARGDLIRAGFANLRCPESNIFGFQVGYYMPRYTHIVIRYRGDGRAYRMTFHPIQFMDVFWYEANRFTLYTRGGPYWQIAKIPISKFYSINKGTVDKNQKPAPKDRMRLISFTLMDTIEGPFSLELDYIAFCVDEQHKEVFAYEEYDRTGIVS